VVALCRERAGLVIGVVSRQEKRCGVGRVMSRREWKWRSRRRVQLNSLRRMKSRLKKIWRH